MKNLWQGIVNDARFIRDHELQPQWYKIFKVFLLLGGMVAFFLIFGGRKTLAFFVCFFGLGLVVHMIYRIKTNKFTQSWLDFQVEEIDGKYKFNRIGIYYYSAVVINGLIAFLISQILVR